jgi:hypothetical protein
MAHPVFVDASGRGITHVVYDAGLRRLIASVQSRSVGETGLFDAPEPWGPWTTIAYYQNWGGYGARESLGIDFPTKWISQDGTTLWGVFSGGRLGQNDDLLDSFNLVKLTLLLRGTVKETLIIQKDDLVKYNLDYSSRHSTCSNNFGKIIESHT